LFIGKLTTKNISPILVPAMLKNHPILLEPLSKALALPPLPPIILAASSGNTEEVRRLLGQEDVDINEKDMHGRTALTLASYHGHSETVQLLLEKGASVDVKNYN
jgi:ankyrin repeat protein